jgi:hypothetical protein
VVVAIVDDVQAVLGATGSTDATGRGKDSGGEALGIAADDKILVVGSVLVAFDLDGVVGDDVFDLVGVDIVGAAGGQDLGTADETGVWRSGTGVARQCGASKNTVAGQLGLVASSKFGVDVRRCSSRRCRSTFPWWYCRRGFTTSTLVSALVKRRQKGCR